jgi:hypothetical protein
VLEREVQKKSQQAGDLAFHYNSSHVHCSQSTLLALMTTYGEKDNLLFRAAGSLAGGGGLQGDSGCGAFAAACLFMGLRIGFNLEDIETDKPPLKNGGDLINKLVRELHVRFTDAYGSIVCSQIHRKLFGRPFYLYDESDHSKLHELSLSQKDNPDFRRCRHVCRDAASWTVEILESYTER